MKNKVCVVTGGTSGIGKQTALGLSTAGATVIIVGRSKKKCRDTVKGIRRITKNDSVEYLLADLSSRAEVRELAIAFKNRYKALHVLVNNAGARFLKRQVSRDGLEMTLALNHLAYFALTNYLLDLLIESAPSRIINVSSGNYTRDIDFNDLNGENHYNGKIAYSQSKLANLVFTFELGKRLEGSGVTANAVAPGGVATNFCRNNGFFYWLKHMLAHTLTWTIKSPKQGAKASIYLASSLEVMGISGKFFYNDRGMHYKDLIFDDQMSRKLWDISMRLANIESQKTQYT